MQGNQSSSEEPIRMQEIFSSLWKLLQLNPVPTYWPRCFTLDSLGDTRCGLLMIWQLTEKSSLSISWKKNSVPCNQGTEKLCGNRAEYISTMQHLCKSYAIRKWKQRHIKQWSGTETRTRLVQVHIQLFSPSSIMQQTIQANRNACQQNVDASRWHDYVFLKIQQGVSRSQFFGNLFFRLQ